MFEEAIIEEYISKKKKIENESNEIEQGEGKKVENEKSELFNRDNSFFLKNKSKFTDKKVYALRANTDVTVTLSPKSIKFSNDDRAINAALDAAVDRGWDTIKIKSDNDLIAQKMWLEARKRGLETKGYEPTNQDLAQLNEKIQNKESLKIKAKETDDRQQPTEEKKDIDNPKKSSDNVVPINTKETITQQVEASTEPDTSSKANEEWTKTVQDALNALAEKNGLTNEESKEFSDQFWEQTQAKMQDQPLSTEKIDQLRNIDVSLDMDSYRKSPEAEIDPYKGVLMNHGRAPYMDNENESTSYFVSIKNSDGTIRKHWGIDLQRAVTEANLSISDKISLQKGDREPVQVERPILDESGNIIDTEIISAYRNSWKIEVNDRVNEPNIIKQNQENKEQGVEHDR